MRNTFLILILVFGIIQVTNSQEYSRKFGKISIDEFSTKTCPIDETAEAMVIHDIGEAYYAFIGDSYKLIYNRKLKIKIFSQAGLDVADFSIPFYEYFDKERISGLKGNVYNLQDGKIVVTKLNTKNAFEEKAGENWYNLKFAMPDVKEGSIFELSYTLTSPYVSDIPTWNFQKNIPVLYSEYTVKMNPHYEFKSLLKGAAGFDEYEVTEGPTKVMIMRVPRSEMIYRYAMKNLPAFKDESYIASANDYLVRLEFQLTKVNYTDGTFENYTSTWPKLCDELMERDGFGKYLKASERKSSSIVEELKIQSLEPIEKAKILEKYVKTKFSFSGSNNYLASKNIDDFFKSKTGNSANVNLFLCGLFKAAGIESRPVILSTRGNGQPQMLSPFLSGFNYVVIAATIDNKTMLFDATDPLSGFGVLPTRCLNYKGLIVQKNNTEWIDLVSNEKSDIQYYLELKPDIENEILVQEGTLKTSGYDAIGYRRKFQDNYDGIAVELLGAKHKEFDSIKQVNLINIEEPFELTFSRNIDLETIEDKIMIDPFCSLVMTENPMKQTVRTNPIDFTYSSSKSFSTVIEIPEGYKLLNKPENMVINNQFGRIVYVISNENPTQVTVTAHYQFTKVKYEASAYKELKDIYNSVVSKFNEKIVLIKKDSIDLI